MHISYKPLWHTRIEGNIRKENLRLVADLTTNIIANIGKGKHISYFLLRGLAYLSQSLAPFGL